MKYTKINPTEALMKFSKTITESTGIKSASKLQTMANILAITENNSNEQGRTSFLNESAMGFGQTTPAQMPNMGTFSNPTNPTGNIGQQFDPSYKNGSDFSTAKMGIAMNVVAQTIGLDLVATIPIDMPLIQYGFMDTVYSGGQIGSAEHKISYIAVDGGKIGDDLDYTKLTVGSKIVLVGADTSGALKDGVSVSGVYMGKSRINAKIIIKVQEVGAFTASSGAFVSNDTESVSDVVSTHDFHAVIKVDDTGVAIIADALPIDAKAVVSEVSALNNHIQSASTVDQITSEPDSREVAEQGTTSRIGLRFFTKQVVPREYSIEGEATRHQVTDLGAYGIDVYEELFKSAQNQLTHSINKHIRTTLFRLGVTTASSLKVSQGANLNLFLAGGGVASKNLVDFDFLKTNTGEFKDIMGNDKTSLFNNIKNGETNSSAENHLTRQRRIQSKMVASQSLIGNISGRGKADFAIVNSQIESAIIDSITLPTSHDTNISTSTQSMYYLGKLVNLDIYVDPSMDWADTRICVGRRGNANDSGLKFMPYDLVSTITTVPEGTMGLKFLVSSRYALLCAGFHPEINYMTIALQSDFGDGFI